MKAIVYTQYGSPEVLELQNVEKPTPKDNEVRIRIRAAVVTPADCSFRRADPFMVRFVYGLFRPRNRILGVELSGEIEEIGREVKGFQAGDQVYGISPKSFGAHAEYVCLPETAPLAPKPANMTDEEAAGICDGALTSLVFLRDAAKIKSGQKVLVNGASGSVGAYAVQLAKYYGADVTGVCSAANVELVRSLGADRVIDYTQTDFTRTGETYDVIFDAVGKSSYSRCKDVLAPAGVYLSTVPSAGLMLSMLMTAIGGGKKAKFVTAGLKQNQQNLDFLRELAESGQLRPVIDRRYPLERIAEAHRYVETGRKKGNVVIAMD
ncbi:NAD(P)-dependent alcohol dehydrogenase [Cohnella candidum]|uniref:NAD(P)-dependent alcohol dehydrogenase n=1 Tax=Cohnella candidum TaxID=2674991 RepID=A0A3G3K2X5_9BACL|nr:NAD(P)-dependent alcohol dehydrogenase [Cohnella candidum]AYQ74823.1 NAD(P)-dependent alcohol dehydrogenase [Cohnella candidum]